jgi:phospholipid/cholesterol/gamma-HCH transport system ATP-binding protein
VSTATEPAPPILRYRDVCIRFGPNSVFDQLQLDVREGEILTLLGGSGSGKSVLLKAALGLVGWQSGAVIVDGEELTDLGDSALLRVRRKLGMLFQSGALFDSLDVYENVAYPLRVRGASDERSIGERVAEVLEMVGLPGIEDKLPAELSGGMRKRVALARAVAQAPKLLLYDEPTTGLDPINVRRISELILELNHKLCVTSLCATHDLASAYMISDRLAMIADRRVAAIGTPSEMWRSDDPIVKGFLTAMPFDGRSAT